MKEVSLEHLLNITVPSLLCFTMPPTGIGLMGSFLASARNYIYLFLHEMNYVYWNAPESGRMLCSTVLLQG